MKKGASPKTASKAEAKAPATPVTLGTKRTCPKCVTKFYDFAKNPVVCPKCESEFDAEKLANVRIPSESKRSKMDKVVPESLVQQDDVELGSSDDTFESLDALGDDDDEVVEDIGVDSDSDDEN